MRSSNVVPHWRSCIDVYVVSERLAPRAIGEVGQQPEQWLQARSVRHDRHRYSPLYPITTYLLRVSASIEEIHQLIRECMLADQHRLRQRLLNSLPGRSGDPNHLHALHADIQKSAQRRSQRSANLPVIRYPEELPIVQRHADIIKAIQENQVVIVCGETGSGKSTQLPKMCLVAGRGISGMVGHTQPRRIAARTIAARIASELQSAVGHAVGYKVRFNDRLSRDTYIKVMTDGILLAETQHDRYLTHYDTIIIDEAHERSLNIDFLLGYLKQLLPKRPELKVIVTSATIDPQRFSRHFDGAPIIEVSGRTYPVEVRFRPVQAEEPDEEDPTVLQAILAAIDEMGLETSGLGRGASQDPSLKSQASPGDILIFLSGEREIRETTEALRKHHPPHTEILPLYARLSFEEQNRVFQPLTAGTTRRIVLATNVAETSLTVPGIRYVIDPGFARISRYSSNARVQRLPIERISRASADQRKGRCGRIAPGVCIRLYSEEDYRQRDEFTDPEILRANLASVILQMKALRLGDVERFPFVEPPRQVMIREGYQTLLELGAVDQRWRITRLGHELAKLPVDPRFGRMILAAREENSLKEVLIIAAALATQDPRVRPMDAQAAADAAHQQFADETSDFLSYLKIWDFYHENARHLSTSKLRKLCQQQFLSYVRLREWHDVHQHLHALVTESGMRLNEEPAKYDSIHRALLTGLLNNVGLRTETHEYLGPRERKFHIFPGSGLFKKGPKWIMAAEIVETNRLYARTVARIHPEWIEQLAAHLLKRSHSDPHWNPKSAHVEAYERIAMHGLVIVPKRRIHFGPIQPKLAREIFIHQGLVEGALPPPISNAPFLRHNRALMDEIRTMEAKARRRNFLIKDEALFEFYDRRVPAEVHNGPLFEKWRRQAERKKPDLLFLSREHLLQSDANAIDPVQFPDSVSMDGVRVPLTYHFDPGGPVDGVTATIPLEALDQISARSAEWLVPGLLKEKITELIRSLPKSLRRNVVPAPEYAERAARTLTFGKGDLLEELSKELHRRVGEEIPREAWRPSALPEYLRLNFEVVDSEGAVILRGRDLETIRRKLKNMETAVPQAPSFGDRDLERRNVIDWKFGDLPQTVSAKRGEFVVTHYPALVDDQHSVSVQVFNSPYAAAREHRGGLRRLFLLQIAEELAAHIDYLPNFDELALLYSPFGTSEELKSELMEATADRVFVGESPGVYAQVEFDRRLRSGWDKLWSAASENASLLEKILGARQAIDLQLDEMTSPLWSQAVDDIRAQLDNLMPVHFVIETPWQWLQQFPRYLNAIQVRLRKLLAGGNDILARDARATMDIDSHWQRYAQQHERHCINAVFDENLHLYRWMIEELRVSLFAQELGTLFPVSAKRLDAQWNKVRQ